MGKDIKICKKCWEKRQEELKKKKAPTIEWGYEITTDGQFLGDDWLEVLNKDNKNWSWQFQYCHLEKSFNEKAPPPDDCPFILEHLMSGEKHAKKL